MQDECKPASVQRCSSVNLNILGVMGDGASGFVLLAKDFQGSMLVLKAVRKQPVFDTTERDALRLEWRCLATNTSCEFLPRGLLAFQTQNFVCMAMDYMESMTLFEYSLTTETKTISEEMMKTVIAQVAEGLHYLHIQGILHRDIKDENIIVSSTCRCKIIDFGMAGDTGNERQMKEECGTPDFMSPEMLMANLVTVTAATDYWSLGVVIYAAIYGEPPIPYSEDKAELQKRMREVQYPEIFSADCVALLQKLLCFVVTGRISTIEVLKQQPWFGAWTTTLNNRLNLEMVRTKVLPLETKHNIFDPIANNADPTYLQYQTDFPLTTLNMACPHSPTNPIETPRMKAKSAVETVMKKKKMVVKKDERFDLVEAFETCSFLHENKAKAPVAIIGRGTKIACMRLGVWVDILQVKTKWQDGVHSTVYLVRPIHQEAKEPLYFMKVFLGKYSARRICEHYGILLKLQGHPLFTKVHKAFDFGHCRALTLYQFGSTKSLEDAISAAYTNFAKTVAILRSKDIHTPETRKDLILIIENRWRRVLLQLIEAVSFMQTVGVLHNSLKTSHVLLDSVNQKIQISGFSRAESGTPSVYYERDRFALTGIARVMFLLREDVKCNSFPDYFSPELEAVFDVLQSNQLLDMGSITSLPFFADFKLTLIEHRCSTGALMGKIELEAARIKN